MRKVVYLLGAGFSAPLGIPTVSNFYWKAKDLLDRDPQRFGHFASSFDVMESFHRVRMFMKADLENIEEILSILEMKDTLSSEPERESFSRFISEVIEAYTPSFAAALEGGQPTFSRLFSGDPLHARYCAFVALLFGLNKASRGGDRWVLNRGEPKAHYSVVSLNYDVVLENALHHIQNSVALPKPIAFHDPKDQNREASGVLLAKLHGSVKGTIVPPTWNKKIHSKILPAWREAFLAVSKANELRFIGYSLPETDSYFRYFLKAAISQSFNLQRVDVLCAGNVQGRYQELFEQNRLRFNSGRTEGYLENLMNHADGQFPLSQELDANLIEVAHHRIFGG
jgi:hypothetical protein